MLIARGLRTVEAVSRVLAEITLPLVLHKVLLSSWSSARGNPTGLCHVTDVGAVPAQENRQGQGKGRRVQDA